MEKEWACQEHTMVPTKGTEKAQLLEASMDSQWEASMVALMDCS